MLKLWENSKWNLFSYRLNNCATFDNWSGSKLVVKDGDQMGSLIRY